MFSFLNIFQWRKTCTNLWPCRLLPSTLNKHVVTKLQTLSGFLRCLTVLLKKKWINTRISQNQELNTAMESKSNLIKLINKSIFLQHSGTINEFWKSDTLSLSVLYNDWADFPPVEHHKCKAPGVRFQGWQTRPSASRARYPSPCGAGSCRGHYSPPPQKPVSVAHRGGKWTVTHSKLEYSHTYLNRSAFFIHSFFMHSEHILE